MRTIALGLLFSMTACGKMRPQSSSESHWLICEKDVDCLRLDGARGCGLEGFCIGESGEPVDVTDGPVRATHADALSNGDCDLRTVSKGGALELGRVIASGRDARGTLWVIDGETYPTQAPNPTTPGFDYLMPEIGPHRVFRLTDEGLQRQRAREVYAVSFTFRPELQSEFHEVVQLEIGQDPGPRTYVDYQTDSYGDLVGAAPTEQLTLLADADGNIVLGTPVGRHDETTPVTRSEELTLLSTPDAAEYDALSAWEYPRYNVVQFAFTLDDNATGATQLVVVREEGVFDSAIVLLGDSEGLVQRQVRTYRREYPPGTPSLEPGADLGRTHLEFIADGMQSELIVPYVGTGTGTGRKVGELSFSIEGVEVGVRDMLSPESAIDSNTSQCFR
jgi:hypothetical protein